MQVRRYGASGPLVIVLHGGPGAAGYMAPVARGLAERIDDATRRRVERLPEEFPDPDQRLAARGNAYLPLYSHDPTLTALTIETCDARAHDETWRDMLRLQEAGIYPAAFAAIKSPVLMLHGAVDPHPGAMIRASLQPCLPQLQYREFERCGHYPWLERAASDRFFWELREWLAARLG